MSYKKLQKEAKSLGLKYVGVSQKKLEKSIKEAKNTQSSTENKSPEKDSEIKVNTAVVSDKTHEIRRYTFDLHGKDFSKLAEQFANDREYNVKLIEVKESVHCPDCGAVINI